MAGVHGARSEPHAGGVSLFAGNGEERARDGCDERFGFAGVRQGREVSLLFVEHGCGADERYVDAELRPAGDEQRLYSGATKGFTVAAGALERRRRRSEDGRSKNGKHRERKGKAGCCGESGFRKDWAADIGDADSGEKLYGVEAGERGGAVSGG